MKRTLWSLVVVAGLLGCNQSRSGPPANCPPAARAESGSPAGQPNPVVAVVGSQQITLSDLDRQIANKLYEARKEGLEEMILERVIGPEADKAKLTGQQYIDKQAESKMTPVTEAEAAAHFAKNSSRIPQLAGKKFEDADVRERYLDFVKRQKREEMAQKVIEEMKAKAGVKITLEPPHIQVAATGPGKGPENARVTIVEFSDFQCPYCGRGRQVMEEVVKAYGPKVRVVFRDFPLPFHENAPKAAEAGHCADEQGKFWVMHDWMFDNQRLLSVEGLKEGAKKLGLDSARFDACLTSGKYAAAVADNLKAGKQAGVNGTPAFFVNGVFINGAQPFERFKEEIDRALSH